MDLYEYVLGLDDVSLHPSPYPGRLPMSPVTTSDRCFPGRSIKSATFSFFFYSHDSITPPGRPLRFRYYRRPLHDTVDRRPFSFSEKPVHKCDPFTEFDCGSDESGSVCIPMEKVCDKNTDCPGFEDEQQDSCNVNECLTDNGGCSQLCVDLPHTFRCACKPGYKLINNSTCDGQYCIVPPV